MNIAFTLLQQEAEARASVPVATPWRHGFARIRASVLGALEASAQARARRHLLDFADRCEANQPELAKELRAAGNMAR